MLFTHLNGFLITVLSFIYSHVYYLYMYYAISVYLADDAGRNGNISHNASLHFSAGLVKFSAYIIP